MSDTLTQGYRVGVERGYEQNFITVQPPLTRDQLEELMSEDVIRGTIPDDYEFAEGTDQKTYIPFGHLFLGFDAMDKASEKYAQEIRIALNKAD